MKLKQDLPYRFEDARDHVFAVQKYTFFAALWNRSLPRQSEIPWGRNAKETSCFESWRTRLTPWLRLLRSSPAIKAMMSRLHGRQFPYGGDFPQENCLNSLEFRGGKSFTDVIAAITLAPPRRPRVARVPFLSRLNASNRVAPWRAVKAASMSRLCRSGRP